MNIRYLRYRLFIGIRDDLIYFDDYSEEYEILG